jgi:hypothetical protein
MLDIGSTIVFIVNRIAPVHKHQHQQLEHHCCNFQAEAVEVVSRQSSS